MYYYASRTPDLKVLSPKMADDSTSLFLAAKREYVLTNLSNAIEKYCLQGGFEYRADWNHWKTQGFDSDGIFCLEEYYPDAIRDTYMGVSGYLYQVDSIPDTMKREETAGGLLVTESLPVCGCEYIPDAYEAILAAAADGTIKIRRFEDLSENTKKIIASLVKEDYGNAADTSAYKSFLADKFQYAWKGKA